VLSLETVFMNLRPTIFALSVAAGISVCLLPSASFAGSFASVAPDSIAELESMHQQAIDSLLKNDFEGAIRAYSDILLVEPDDETAYTGLGQIYMVLGRYQKAVESFQNALEINPDNQVAILGIQTVMDPDGVEGMVSRQQAEYEPSPLLPQPVGAAPMKAESVQTLEPQAILPELAPKAKMDKRRSAVKAVLRAGARPAAPRAESFVRRLPVGLRPGHLHAQRAQMALRNAGFYDGPVNGLIGTEVKASIRDFQKSFGLEQNGRLTAVTWAKLSEYLSAR
jgi:tetratricopeptide (TPR) repeat protein